MTIKFNCTVCNSSVTTPDAMAGKKGKCPTCGSVIQIPSPPKPAAPSTPVLRPADPKMSAPKPSAPPASPGLPPLQPLQPLEPLPPLNKPKAPASPALQPLKPIAPPSSPSGALPPLALGGMAGDKNQGVGADGLYTLQPVSSPGPLLSPLDDLPAVGASGAGFSLPPAQPAFGTGLPNPYATPSYAPVANMGGFRQQAAAWPIIVPGVITLLGNLLALVYCVLNTAFAVNVEELAANQPAEARAGFYIGAYGALIIMPVFTLLAMAGSVCMLFRRGYVMAIIGSILSSLGCACILFPAGIWSLVVLCIPDYRQQFYRRD